MNDRSMLDGLPSRLYLRTPFWYWLRYMRSDPLRLALGGRYHGQDFWVSLNRGWYDLSPWAEN
jgi:hypothetical protein